MGHREPSRAPTQAASAAGATSPRDPTRSGAGTSPTCKSPVRGHVLLPLPRDGRLEPEDRRAGTCTRPRSPRSRRRRSSLPPARDEGSPPRPARAPLGQRRSDEGRDAARHPPGARRRAVVQPPEREQRQPVLGVALPHREVPAGVSPSGPSTRSSTPCAGSPGSSAGTTPSTGTARSASSPRGASRRARRRHPGEAGGPLPPGQGPESGTVGGQDKKLVKGRGGLPQPTAQSGCHGGCLMERTEAATTLTLGG